MEFTPCSICKGPYHPATGHYISPTMRWCGPCTREHVDWLWRNLKRRWGGERFYDHAYVPGPAPKSVLEVLEQLRKNGHEAYLVGGCVRDIFLGRVPKDFDVATDAEPLRVMEIFPTVIPTGILHGTVTVINKAEHVEVTTYRAESDYLDGRRPSKVEFRKNIEDDLSRRDFTINAMALDPSTGELKDPFGGREDLSNKLIRCVGAPTERFTEDGLRSMRAARFAAVLGFELETNTREAIPASMDSFRKVAAERIQAELVKILLSDRALVGLKILQSTGMMEVFLPWLAGHQLIRPEVVPAEINIRLAAMLWPLGSGFDYEDLLLGLKFPTETARAVNLWLHFIPEMLASARRSDGDLRRFASLVGGSNIKPMLQVLEIWQTSERDILRERFPKILGSNPPLSIKELALNGKDVMDILGVKTGPKVGETMRYLLAEVLEDPKLNTKEALRTLVERK